MKKQSPKASNRLAKTATKQPKIATNYQNNRANTSVRWAERVVLVTCLIIVALVPFHAFLTTWAGSNFGHLDVWRIWKELLLFASLPFAIYLARQTPGYKAWLASSWLPRLIFAYAALYVIFGLYALAADRVTSAALLYAWFADLRYLAFFLVASLAAYRLSWFRPKALKVVAVGSAVVVGFGLLQITLLPHDFLRHFGYGADTIPAYQTVDNKLEYQRIQSTTRGANPLGAYLVVVISLVAAWLVAKSKQRRLYAPAAVLMLVCLWFTYSRSALLGVMAALAILAICCLPLRQLLRLAAVGAVGLALLVGGIVLQRDNDLVQNTVFHSDEKSKSATSSNFDRFKAQTNAIRDIVDHPLGGGPGTAGPASLRNDKPARIAENYYLQIAQEVGVVGLAMLVTITCIVGQQLWRYRHDWLAAALLASLGGLVIVNLLSHAWADDTLGLLWWGLAGVVYGSVILKNR